MCELCHRFLTELFQCSLPHLEWLNNHRHDPPAYPPSVLSAHGSASGASMTTSHPRVATRARMDVAAKEVARCHAARSRATPPRSKSTTVPPLLASAPRGLEAHLDEVPFSASFIQISSLLRYFCDNSITHKLGSHTDFPSTFAQANLAQRRSVRGLSVLSRQGSRSSSPFGPVALTHVDEVASRLKDADWGVRAAAANALAAMGKLLLFLRI